MATKRAAKKVGAKPPGKPFAKGDDARRGRGPAKGAPNAGRPKRGLRGRMRDSLETRLHIAEEIADNPLHPAGDRMRALDFLAKYGVGPKPQPQKVEVSGPNGGPVPVQSWRIGENVIPLG